jgi:predicted RNase H-like HicB family nuclease
MPIYASSVPSYPIVIERGENNFSAYAPDVPGCVAVGDSVEETVANMAEALEFHFEGLRLDGDPIPMPGDHVAYVDVAA